MIPSEVWHDEIISEIKHGGIAWGIRMTRYSECSKRTVLTSPAINRLLKSYKHYIQDCISNDLVIHSLYDFYTEMVRLREVAKTRVFDDYVKRMQVKQSVQKDKETYGDMDNQRLPCPTGSIREYREEQIKSKDNQDILHKPTKSINWDEVFDEEEESD